MTVTHGDDGCDQALSAAVVPVAADDLARSRSTEGKREKVRLHARPATRGRRRQGRGRRGWSALGARTADVGQTGDEGFTVLADPEGNEFCVLHGDPR